MRTIILVLFLIATSVCSASYQPPAKQPLTKDNDGHAIIDQMLSIEHPRSNIFITSYFITHCAHLVKELLDLELKYYQNICVDFDFSAVYPLQYIRSQQIISELQQNLNFSSFTEEDEFILEHFFFFFRMKYLYSILGSLEQWVRPFRGKDMNDVPAQYRQVVLFHNNAKALINRYVQEYMKSSLKQ